MNPEHLYADGGVILKNPSPHGGAWAFCWVSQGVRTRTDSGLVLPREYGLEAVTNNVTELLAAVKALQSVEHVGGWRGVLWTDSQVTLYRLLNARSWKGIPYPLRDEALRLRRLLWPLDVRLVAGHPTLVQLAAGRDEKGTPASEHNVWCDSACGEESRKYREGAGA